MAKAKPEMIYLLMRHTGSYSDYRTCPCNYALTKAEADAMLEAASEELKAFRVKVAELQNKFDDGKFSYESLKTMLRRAVRGKADPEIEPSDVDYETEYSIWPVERKSLS